MSSLTFSLIQSTLHWNNKVANLAMFEQKINTLDEKTELVVLPEMFNTGFSMDPHSLAETMEGETIAWMKRLAISKKVIITGSLMIEEKGLYYNRLVWMLPSGNYGVYDKRHRFAYGGETDQFAAGSKRTIASVKGWRLNLLICYDLRFPVWSRQAHPNPAQDGSPLEYDVLLYVANWPQKRSHAWNSLLPARAIENQSYVVAVNRVGTDGNNIAYHGDSMVVDPFGKILVSKTGEEAILTITLHKEELEEARRQFPFWKDADSFSIYPFSPGP